MLMPYSPRRIAPTMPIFVVLNDGSGARDGDATQQAIESACERRGRRHRLFRITDAGQIGSIATLAAKCAKEHDGIVVAAGGDGTLNAVAQAVLAVDGVLGVLPRGTFNYFGRSHNIPTETEPALETLLNSEAWPVQVGTVNDRIFLVNASVGLYPQLLQDREAWKQQFGRRRIVALGAAMATILREHRQLRLRLEHGGQARALRTPTLFVGNNRLQLEQIGLPEAPALDEHRLAAVAIRPIGTLAMLGLLLRGALGRLGEADSVISFPFQSLTVTPYLDYGRHRVKIATDGEVAWMRMPLKFGIAPRPLWLLRPGPDAAAA